MVFRILIRCFLRTQEFFKDIAKQLVNWVETGPMKEKSTNSNFFPHYLEFHMNFFLEFQFFSSIFLEFNMNFFWNSNFFWNFICLEQTGLLISSVYYRCPRQCYILHTIHTRLVFCTIGFLHSIRRGCLLWTERILEGNS